MPNRISILSFQRQFSGLILDGSKPHTVRANAARIHPGDILHLYTGLRTKAARRFFVTYCVSVEPIRIGRNSLSIRRDDRWTRHDAAARQTFAFNDGFREPDAWRAFVLFFEKSLPFEGALITWLTPPELMAQTFGDIGSAYASGQPTEDIKTLFQGMSVPMLNQFLPEIGRVWAAAEHTRRRMNKETSK